MPSPKSADVVSPESPEEPEEAEEAMESEAGQVEETEADPGEDESTQTGSTTVDGMAAGGAAGGAAAAGGGEDSEEEETHKVDILLKDSKGKAVANEPFKVKFDDGSTKSGRTDKDGKATLKDVPAGNCEITFTKIHETEVKAK